MRLYLSEVGKHGLITDFPPSEIPPEAWTSVQNMRTKDGYMERIAGEAAVTGTLLHAPRNVFPAPNPFFSFWVYAGLSKVSVVLPGEPSDHTDITRISGDYTGTIEDKWNGAWINGVLFLNNGVNTPQVWHPIDDTVKLVDLPNWPTDTLVKCMRQYKNFVIGLNVTDDATGSPSYYPTTVMWSHPAQPGTYPPSWDPGDATMIAGRRPLSNTPGPVVDCLQLGDANVIYKRDAIVLQQVLSQLTAGRSPFSWIDVSTGTGIMSQQCAIEFKPRLHAVFTFDGDLVVFNGQTIESVLEKKVLKYLEDTISPNYRTNSFLTVDNKRKEVWVCYPTGGDSICSEALIWNWKDGGVGVRRLSPTYDIKRGIYDSNIGPVTWQDLGGTWDAPDPAFAWSRESSELFMHQMIGAAYSSSALHQLNTGTSLDTQNFTASVERTGLCVLPHPNGSGLVQDKTIQKLVTEVWPVIEAPTGMVVSIFVGRQNSLSDTVTWQGPFPFRVGIDEKIDCLWGGRYNAVRFHCTEQIDWKLHGYGLEIHPDGVYGT